MPRSTLAPEYIKKERKSGGEGEKRQMRTTEARTEESRTKLVLRNVRAKYSNHRGNNTEIKGPKLLATELKKVSVKRIGTYGKKPGNTGGWKLTLVVALVLQYWCLNLKYE